MSHRYPERRGESLSMSFGRGNPVVRQRRRPGALAANDTNGSIGG
jgi:hypothetical protein